MNQPCIGDGPEFERLKARATDNVEMLGYQDDETLASYMKRASAFVFGAVEDFGIMPVEAQACGTPVIGLRRGGVAETVIDGETGILFDEQTPESVAEAVNTFHDLPAGFLDPDQIRKNAERFSVDRFHREFETLVETAIDARRSCKPQPTPVVSQSLHNVPQLLGV